MTENDIYHFVNCYKIDDFYKKILLNNISKNKEFVLDGLVDFTLSNDLSIIKDYRVSTVLQFLRMVNQSGYGIDKGKLMLSISKLEYFCSIIDHHSHK